MAKPENELELSVPEQEDVARVLFLNKDLLEGAFLDNDFPSGRHEKMTAHRIVVLQKCQGLLTVDWALCDDFGRVLDSVLDGRPVHGLNQDDCAVMAARYREWLPLPLSAGWYPAIYESRHG